MNNDRNLFAWIAAETKLICAVGAGVWLLFAFSIHAAEFNERVKSPEEMQVSELKVALSSFFSGTRKTDTMSGLLRNDSLHRHLFNLRWQILRAIDTRRPLSMLAEYGFVDKGNGVYEVDLDQFPSWYPLHERMQTHLSAQMLDKTLPELRKRGFRDGDVQLLLQYLGNNNLQASITAETVPLTKSFAARVKASADKKQRLTEREAVAYQYQTMRAADQVSRAWAIGLLNVLDAQRQRILESYLTEISMSMAIFPSEGEGAVEQLENWFLSGRFLDDLEQQIQNATSSTNAEDKK